MPIRGYLVLTLAFAAVLCDLRTGRIPNLLCLLGILAGGITAAGEMAGAFAGSPAVHEEIARRLAGLAGGIALPLIPGFVLFHFRMIGAGDIKLLAAAGSIMGAASMPAFLLMTLVLAGLIAVPVMLFAAGMRARMHCFAAYLRECGRTGRAESYREFSAAFSGESRESAVSHGSALPYDSAVPRGSAAPLSSYEFHFTIPMCMAAILYAGGLL